LLGAPYVAIYTLKNDSAVFSANANSILKEAYNGLDVKGTITSTTIETLSNDILFQKDTKSTSGRTYWYFNDDFENNPEFDRLKMLGATYDAIYTLKNDSTVFSANANSILKEAYNGLDVKGTITSTIIETLANDILFQKDLNSTSGQTYWYFNGDFETSPAFDRLKMLGGTYDAPYTLKNDSTVFSANANSILKEAYNGLDVTGTITSTIIETLPNDILFQKDLNSTSGQTYWYFNGDFETSPAFDRLKMLGGTYDAPYTLKNDSTVFSAN